MSDPPSAPQNGAAGGLTDDRFLGGRVSVRQRRRGYRAGADAVLLAAAVTPGARLLEAGCGAGTALLCVAHRFPEASLVGIEREQGQAELARANIEANGMQDRVTVLHADLFAERDVFDGVFCNPPFDSARAANPPHPARRHAYLTEHGVDAWIKELANWLHGGAALTLIHRAERLPDILASLDGRLGGVSVLPVRPRAEEPAKRVLVRAIKGSRAPLRLLKGLDLHDAGGAKFTPEADAIFRGDAAIAWE
jgi:tRNA1(Val) A37 N6-methylase TrmN6